MKTKSLFLVTAIAVLFLFACKDSPETPGQGTNTAPSGTISPIKAILLGEIISIAATVEDTDADDTLSYKWEVSSAPSGSTALLTGGDTLKASFTPDLPGIYGIKLTVSDGTDSVELSGSLSVVGFAIGVNNNSRTAPAVLNNSEIFTPLETPEDWLTEAICLVDQLKLKNGNMVCGGNYASTQQGVKETLVYWKDGNPTPVSGKDEMSSYQFSKLELDSAEKIHAIFSETKGSIAHYWTEASGYDYAIIAPNSPWTFYNIQDVTCIGSDVYQIGSAGNDTAPNITYFMAKNLNETHHSLNYSLGTNDQPYGTLVIPGSTDSETVTYIYGSHYEEPNTYAGYVAADGVWQKKSEGVYIEDGRFSMHYMASLDDYIISLDMLVADDMYTVCTVYTGGQQLEMEEPLDCTNFEYVYLEIIDGSVFVAGSYDVGIVADTGYRVFAVWRDGKIVFSASDNDGSYKDGSLGFRSADFE